MRKIVILLAAVCFAASSVVASEAEKAQVVSAVHAPLWKAFSLSDVKLTDSYFKQTMDHHSEYILSLEIDRLIPHVRRQAGLEPKGKNYGGWEAGGGCTYGHYMSSCALMYAATGDKRYMERLDYLLSELKECQDKTPDGWFVNGEGAKRGFEDMIRGELLLNKPDEAKQPWNFNRNGNGWYGIHKVMAGLRDAYVYAGCEKAKDILVKLSDYAANIALKSNSDLFQAMLGVEQGGMNDVMAEVYAITGDKKYLLAAQKFNHINVIYTTANGEDVLFGRHANDQIPKFVGVARLYEFSDNDLYKRAAENFWDIVVDDHTNAIGGNSCYERFGHAGEQSKRLDFSSSETCNTYNMLKLSKQLFMLSGDMKYMQYYEKALYNHILASIDPCHSGAVTYYTTLLPGSVKQYSSPHDSFWCCVGTGLENHAKYAESIYFKQENALMVNLFIPSKLDWKERGLRLTMKTSFPESDTVSLKVDANDSFTGPVVFRYPSWVKGDVTLFKNGVKANAEVKQGQYVKLNTPLKAGDELTLVVPRTLYLDYVADEPNFGSVMYGPLVMAGELGVEGMPQDIVSDNRELRSFLPLANIPMLVGDCDNLGNWIVKDAPLHFTVHNGGKQANVGMVPYFKMHHQRNTVYWKIYTDANFAYRNHALLDEVVVADAKSDKAHNLQGMNDTLRLHDFFWSSNTFYRDARNGGWFSYDVKIDKGAKPHYIICRYWGDCPAANKFDIYVDGQLFKNVNLNRRDYLTYVDDVYEIPVSMTRGKSKATVKFVASDDNTAGGLFSLKVTTDPDMR